MSQQALKAEERREKEGVLINLKPEDFGKPVDGIDSNSRLESFRMHTAYSKDSGRFVRSGMSYDIDSTDAVRPMDAERAAKVKMELGDEAIKGIEDRLLYRFAKRAFDIVFSAMVLICFSWLYMILAIIVKVDDPKGPVFFKQERVGKNGKTFYMYKFRSMCADAESRLDELQALNEKTGPVFKIADDPRITRAGKWLRKLSLAPVIIGTPGDGEPTKSLSHPENSSLDLQKCERRPGTSLGARHHYTSLQFLSFAVFGGLGAAWGRRRCARGVASLRGLRAVA